MRLALIVVGVSVAMCAVAVPAAQAKSSAPATPTYERQAYSFWKAFECAMAVGLFIAGNTYLVLKVKRLGGVLKYAKSLWKAKSAEERAKLIGKVFAYVAGTGALIKVCTP